MSMFVISTYFFALCLSSLVPGVTFGYKSVDAERDKLIEGTFPDGFMWGAATAAFQIEGASSADGKGESIYDLLGKLNQLKGATGKLACDSYHKYKDDVRILKKLGVTHYRFSIAWTRIMPNGTKDSLNQAGINYYTNLIDELQKVKIEPMVTLFHFDLPMALQSQGGWFNDTIVDLFNDYAQACFEHFGRKVKFWLTLNEPFIHAAIVLQFWKYQANGQLKPEAKDPYNVSKMKYLAYKNLILSHAKAYRTYETMFKSVQGGKVSIALNTEWCEPRTDQKKDIDACERFIEFQLGSFANPIYVNGDFPAIVKQIVNSSSHKSGRTSRLPSFTEAEKKMIKGTSDYFAINFYTAVLGESDNKTVQSYDGDVNTKTLHDSNWPYTGLLEYYKVPWGLRKLLKRIKTKYDNPDIYITENGCMCPNENKWSGRQIFNDTFRQDWYKRYINEALKAVKLDGVKLKAFTAWTLMDNLEWGQGFTARFGLYYTNRSDSNLSRLPKDSVSHFQKIIKDNGFTPSPVSQGSKVYAGGLGVLVFLWFIRRALF